MSKFASANSPVGGGGSFSAFGGAFKNKNILNNKK